MPQKTSTISVTRLQHETAGDDHFLIEFPRTNDRGLGKLIMPVAQALDSGQCTKKLISQGADLAPSVAVQQFEDPNGPIGVLHDLPGWKADNVFMLPNAIFGESKTIHVFDPSARAAAHVGSVSGSLAEWKTHVATPVGHSYIAATALLSAFAAPLLPFSKLSEDFIINLAGPSSGGKSTATLAAYSVWGNPQRMPNWQATDRGVEESAAAFNHLLFAIDDLERADRDPKKRVLRLHQNTHTLTSGTTQGYSGAVTDPSLRLQRFRTITMTSSPYLVEVACRDMGVLRTDGDRTRLFELRVPEGKIGGVWASLKKGSADFDSRAYSDGVRDAAQANFGVAGQAFAEWLVANHDRLEWEVNRLTARFMKIAMPGATGVEARIGSKVALLYAGGKLAKKAGLLSWEPAAVLQTCKWALKEVLDCAFSPLPVKPVAKAIQTFIADEKLVDAKTDANLSDISLPGSRAGFLWRPKKRAYIRYQELTQVIEGALAEQQGAKLDAKTMIDELVGRHVIIPQGRNPSSDIRLNGNRQRLVVVDHLELKKMLRRGKKKKVLKKDRLPGTTANS